MEMMAANPSKRPSWDNRQVSGTHPPGWSRGPSGRYILHIHSVGEKVYPEAMTCAQRPLRQEGAAPTQRQSCRCCRGRGRCCRGRGRCCRFLSPDGAGYDPARGKPAASRILRSRCWRSRIAAGAAPGKWANKKLFFFFAFQAPTGRDNADGRLSRPFGAGALLGSAKAGSDLHSSSVPLLPPPWGWGRLSDMARPLRVEIADGLRPAGAGPAARPAGGP